jgi:drug/metabolite transporter (DMT)-like permease
MFSRILVSLAAVVASVGLLLYGMGTSYNPENDGIKTLGVVMMIGGLIGLGAGIVWYRQVEAAEERAVEAEINRRS